MNLDFLTHEQIKRLHFELEQLYLSSVPAAPEDYYRGFSNGLRKVLWEVGFYLQPHPEDDDPAFFTKTFPPEGSIPTFRSTDDYMPITDEEWKLAGFHLDQ
jgi:hypothetical protein